MKKTVLVSLLFLTVTVLRVTAAEYWVEGVSRNGGWYDAVKYGNLNDSRDSNLCWAASAANMLQWWQDRYEIPDGIPNGDDIWNDIRNSTENTSNTTNTALTAYLLKYYSDLYPNSQYITNSGLVDYLQFLGSPDNFTKPSSYLGLGSYIVNKIKGGNAIGLGAYFVDSSGSEFGHAVTLWGVAYNEETQLLEKLWITDSDDKHAGLLEMTCSTMTYKDITRISFTPTSLSSATFEGSEYAYILSVSTLAADDARMTLKSIPEPHAATLLLTFALCALARRNRRA